MTIISALIIGGFIYFVAGVSSVTPPIKKYQYLGSVNQLLSGIQRYASTNPNVTFKITDTVGCSSNGYGIYMTIGMKKNGHDITYRLMCEGYDTNSIGKTKVHLILAFDETNNTGGYHISGEGVKSLLDDFEKNLLVGLKNTVHIKIIPCK